MGDYIEITTGGTNTPNPSNQEPVQEPENLGHVTFSVGEHPESAVILGTPESAILEDPTYTSSSEDTSFYFTYSATLNGKPLDTHRSESLQDFYIPLQNDDVILQGERGLGYNVLEVTDIKIVKKTVSYPDEYDPDYDGGIHETIEELKNIESQTVYFTATLGVPYPDLELMDPAQIPLITEAAQIFSRIDTKKRSALTFLDYVKLEVADLKNPEIKDKAEEKLGNLEFQLETILSNLPDTVEEARHHGEYVIREITRIIDVLGRLERISEVEDNKVTQDSEKSESYEAFVSQLGTVRTSLETLIQTITEFDIETVSVLYLKKTGKITAELNALTRYLDQVYGFQGAPKKEAVQYFKQKLESIQSEISELETTATEAYNTAKTDLSQYSEMLVSPVPYTKLRTLEGIVVTFPNVELVTVNQGTNFKVEVFLGYKKVSEAEILRVADLEVKNQFILRNFGDLPKGENYRIVFPYAAFSLYRHKEDTEPIDQSKPKVFYYTIVDPAEVSDVPHDTVPLPTWIKDPSLCPPPQPFPYPGFPYHPKPHGPMGPFPAHPGHKPFNPPVPGDKPKYVHRPFPTNFGDLEKENPELAQWTVMAWAKINQVLYCEILKNYPRFIK